MHGGLGTGPHSRRWEAGEREKLHLYLRPLPIACITIWALLPVRSVAALDSHRSTISVMGLNHLETILPTQSMEKLSSMKPVPGAKKVGDHWFRQMLPKTLFSGPLSLPILICHQSSRGCSVHLWGRQRSLPSWRYNPAEVKYNRSWPWRKNLFFFNVNNLFNNKNI